MEIKNLDGKVIHSVDSETLENAFLGGAYLRRADLSGSNLEGADLTDADLREAKIDHSNLKHARLQNAILEEADLHCSDLRGTMTEGAVFREADLSGANITDVEFVGLDFTRVKLNDANLTNASLFDVFFHTTDFRRANVKDATLHACRFWCPDFREVNLSDADKIDLMLNEDRRSLFWSGNARFDSTTQFPPGIHGLHLRLAMIGIRNIVQWGFWSGAAIATLTYLLKSVIELPTHACWVVGAGITGCVAGSLAKIISASTHKDD